MKNLLVRQMRGPCIHYNLFRRIYSNNTISYLVNVMTLNIGWQFCLLLSVTADHLHRTNEGWSVPIETNSNTLTYVQLVWRHGDRTPSFVFPDSESEKWKDGLGELTKEGIQQQYRLGKWLRRRYGNWLGETFDRAEVYVRSSDYNRTLMSASANMAGLFPPHPSEIWDHDLPWQPVPVHSMPRDMDRQLYEEIKCPVAEQELKRVFSSDSVKQIEEKYADFLKFIGKNAGLSDFSLRDMWKIYDQTNCQFYHNSTNPWPSWVNQSVFEELVRIYDLSSQFEFHTNVLRRLRGGPLLGEIYERFQAKADGTLGSKARLYAYSAHDTTLAALLAAMGVFPEMFPRYATMVIVEMHTTNGVNEIKLFHKNKTDSEDVYEFAMPDCPVPCTLSKLSHVVENYVPNHWDNECGLVEKPVSLLPYIVTICVLAVTSAVLLAIIVCDVVVKRRRMYEGREPLIQDEAI